MEEYYGVVVTPIQLEVVLDKDPEFKRDLIRYNSPSDTADREVLGDLFMKEIVGSRWPCYGDTDEYRDAFFEKLRARAPELGYTFLG